MLIKKKLIILFQNTYFYVSEHTAFLYSSGQGGLPSPPVCGYVRKHIPLDGYTMPFRFMYRTDDSSLSLDTSAVWYTNVKGIE